VKQICSLSTILFDICVDSHIEKLSSKKFKPYWYWWSDLDGIIAQAYAGDIFLFSRSYEGMMELVRVVQDFIRESNIRLNP
jgi:hypothetical protein